MMKTDEHKYNQMQGMIWEENDQMRSWTEMGWIVMRASEACMKSDITLVAGRSVMRSVCALLLRANMHSIGNEAAKPGWSWQDESCAALYASSKQIAPRRVPIRILPVSNERGTDQNQVASIYPMI